MFFTRKQWRSGSCPASSSETRRPTVGERPDLDDLERALGRNAGGLHHPDVVAVWLADGPNSQPAVV